MVEINEEYVRGLEANQIALMEQLDNVVASMNDAAGWEVLYSNTSSQGMGLNLGTLKHSAEILRDMVETNPLFKRGHELRHAYTYANGWALEGQKAGVKAVMDDPFNRDTVFDFQALSQGMKARHVDGNRFLLKLGSDKQLYNIPLSQIANAYVDENDPSRILYIKRSWIANGKERSAWYPTGNMRKSGRAIASSIDVNGSKEAVDKTATIFHKAYNRQAGMTWGIPDFLAAMLWAKAYSAYLKDNATLVKAYSRIALKISANTEKGANTASATVAQNTAVGTTAIHDTSTDVTVMPATGSTVDFNNGRPLAAMVASAFGLSIVALLSDPGTGGSYGVAETLDPPTLLLAKGLQDDEKDFFEEVLRSYANPNLTITFPSIESDPAYRTGQTIAQGHAQGFLHREEARAAYIKLLDIENPKRGLPKADGFSNWSDPDASKNAAQGGDGGKVDPTPGQGKSGAAGSQNQGTDNSARDNGEYDQ